MASVAQTSTPIIAVFWQIICSFYLKCCVGTTYLNTQWQRDLYASLDPYIRSVVAPRSPWEQSLHAGENTKERCYELMRAHFRLNHEVSECSIWSAVGSSTPSQNSSRERMQMGREDGALSAPRRWAHSGAALLQDREVLWPWRCCSRSNSCRSWWSVWRWLKSVSSDAAESVTFPATTQLGNLSLPVRYQKHIL